MTTNPKTKRVKNVKWIAEKPEIKKVKAWAIIEKGKVLVWDNNLSKNQHEIFLFKEQAEQNCRQWIKSGYKAQVVACEIIYHPPTTPA